MTEIDEDVIHCDVNDSGICGLHKVEVERRRAAHRATDKSIMSLELSLKALADKMPGISRTVYVIFVSGSLLLGMITAGFVYTRDTGQSSVERDLELAAQQAMLTEKITQMAINSARSEGQQSTLMTEMRSFTIAAQKILQTHQEMEEKLLREGK